MFTGPNIVTDGLILALDAANGKSYTSTGTTWVDLSGNGNNGTLVNGPTFDSGNGGGIVFDGVDDYVDIDTNLLNFRNSDTNRMGTSTKGTIEIFAKTSVGFTNRSLFGYWNSSNPTSMRGGIVIGNGTSAYSDELFTFLNVSPEVVGGNTRAFTIVARKSGVPNEFTLLDGNFHHFAVVVESGNNAMYVDGESQQISLQFGETYLSFLNGIGLDTIRLGVDGFNNGRFYYNSSIHSVKIYNRALTSQEIQQNYNATKSRYGL